jgi:hypothetical protein
MESNSQLATSSSHIAEIKRQTKSSNHIAESSSHLTESSTHISDI